MPWDEMASAFSSLLLPSVFTQKTNNTPANSISLARGHTAASQAMTATSSFPPSEC